MKRRGFTLVEVLVALFVIALGVGALLTTLMSSANAAQYLRDKTLAQWIALNRVSEARLAGSRNAVGPTSDTVEYANAVWRWRQEIADTGITGLMRIEVRVARLGEIGDELVDPGGEGEMSTVGRAVGFIGAALARPNGLTPEWSLRPPANPGDAGGGGGGGGGGPGPNPGGDPQ